MNDGTVDPDLFRVDRDRLDEEWERQPGTFFRLAERLAKAEADMERAKAALELAEATLQKEVRRDPAGYGVDKVTDKSVEAAVLSCGSYRKAVEAYIEAKYDRDVTRAAVTALDHKKAALERLVSLHGQNYFSQPKAKDEGGRKVRGEAETGRAFGGPKKRRASRV